MKKGSGKMFSNKVMTSGPFSGAAKGGGKSMDPKGGVMASGKTIAATPMGRMPKKK